MEARLKMSFDCKRCRNVANQGVLDYCFYCIKVFIHENEESKTMLLPTHETEKKYPEQTTLFKEITNRMYCIHLEKNADYSPMNILATGIVGLATRIWDKTARICNLLGFNLQTGEFSRERGSNKDESIEDNLLDLAVYCIIALIYRAGKWGK